MRDGFEPLGDVSSPGAAAAVGVILQDHSGRILLQLRDAFPDVIWGGYWSFFGGGVEPGEDFRAAALREIVEELGISLGEDELKPFRWVCSTSERRTRLYVYWCQRRVEPAEIRLGEGAGFAFWDKQQIEELQFVPFMQPVLMAFTKMRRNTRPGA